jgi:predicted permease
VIGTLAVGIGSATAVYSVVDALLVRPIPFEEPDRLVTLSARAGGVVSLDREVTQVWHAQERIFADVRTHLPGSFIVTGAGEARRVGGHRLEPGFLEMLGIRPVLGRGLSPEDALPGNDQVVLLSDQLWSAAFARDADAIGRTIEVNGEPHTVVGVLPPTLRFLLPVVVGLVLPLTEAEAGPVLAIGRLRPELSTEAAQARTAEIARGLSEARPREGGWGVELDPLRRLTSGEIETGLVALGGGVLCLLLIACANAGGLLLLRGVSRRRELELRRALGASSIALTSQVFAESLVLAIWAGVLGAALARWCVGWLVALLPDGALTFSYTVVAVDGRVLLFCLGLTIVTCLLFGMGPAIRAGRTGVARAGRTTTSSRDEVRLRAGILVAQLALAVVLLTGAGLFGRSFLRLTFVSLGYEADHLLRLDLVSLERLRGREATVDFARVLDDRLRALPSVEAVARTGGAGFAVDYTLQTEGGEPRPSGSALLPSLSVDTAYFRAMGIELVEGRAFGPDDLVPGSNTVVIDSDLAAYLWPEGNAVGRTFRVRDEPWLRVVGVTDDVKLEGPNDPLGPYLVFYAATHDDLRNATVLLRTKGDPRLVAPMVREALRALDRGQPIRSLQTGREVLGGAVANPRLFLTVMGLLAAIALVLAAVGVYGLVSFTVEQERREIGIRVALGAGAKSVVLSVVRWGLGLGALGIAIGQLGVVALNRFVAAILYETSSLEPTVLAAASVVLLLSCGGALVSPALRAAATDPAEVLRAE